MRLNRWERHADEPTRAVVARLVPAVHAAPAISGALAMLAAGLSSLSVAAAAGTVLRCPAWKGADWRPLVSMELGIHADPKGAVAVIACRYRIGRTLLSGSPPCHIEPISRTLEAPPAAIVQICDAATGAVGDCSVTCSGPRAEENP
jgi:hypothetical protein